MPISFDISERIACESGTVKLDSTNRVAPSNSAASSSPTHESITLEGSNFTDIPLDSFDVLAGGPVSKRGLTANSDSFHLDGSATVWTSRRWSSWRWLPPPDAATQTACESADGLALGQKIRFMADGDPEAGPVN